MGRRTEKGQRKMRVLVLVKASPESETGQFPPDFKDLVSDMQKYNEELVKAGVMLAADGLYPSSKGKRVRFDGTKRSIIDGPFAETKELVAGFWIWQVRSMDEAVEWLKRAPFQGGDVEIRPIQEAEDFAKDLGDPAVAERDAQLREQLAGRS
jgi:hypothetical protein